MRTCDFEKAIDALSMQGLEVTKFSYGINGQVVAVYARKGELTYLKWDYAGRGYRFDINPGVEGCTVVSQPEYLDYRRAKEFDLKFE